MKLETILAELERIEGLAWENSEKAAIQAGHLRSSLSPLDYRDTEARLIADGFSRVYRLLQGAVQ